MKEYLFTAESVSEGHPDKVADQISDAIVDSFLFKDPESRVACETLVTTGQVIVAGEISSSRYVDIPHVVRKTIRKIGYTDSELMFDADGCGILTAIHEQSRDIARGVVGTIDHVIAEQGAGDQGIMFGYATNETENFMPIELDMAHTIVYSLASIRKQHQVMTYLRPDTKSQVTMVFNEKDEPIKIHTLVISTQHDPSVTREQIEQDIKTHLLPIVAQRDNKYKSLLYDNDGNLRDFLLLVNPTGLFTIGGPHGDTGLTGRKIIVDTYGGRGAHGGGAFSGKDPSKVDRSAAYMARYMAKNMVAAGVADRMLIQLSYAIGVARPIHVYVNTYGTGNKNILSDEDITKAISQIFNLTPAGIISKLQLKSPIYEETASYGHFGRKNEKVIKTFIDDNEAIVTKEVELFTWEKLDMISSIKKYFNI